MKPHRHRPACAPDGLYVDLLRCRMVAAERDETITLNMVVTMLTNHVLEFKFSRSADGRAMIQVGRLLGPNQAAQILTFGRDGLLADVANVTT